MKNGSRTLFYDCAPQRFNWGMITTESTESTEKNSVFSVPSVVNDNVVNDDVVNAKL
jgi:hypothetical protein